MIWLTYPSHSSHLRQLGSVTTASTNCHKHLPKESVFHFSGNDILVSADASRGSSPTVTEDMVVAQQVVPEFGVALPRMAKALWRPRVIKRG